jgi:two-component SAPR family response regulator
MGIKVLLVDDEQLQLTRLESVVKKVLPEVEIFSYVNPVKALEESKDKGIDIAFLDIEMPKITGIKLAKSLKAVNPTINIIFATAYDSFALEAMKMHASGYVSKPVNEEKIRKEIDGLRFPIELKEKKKVQVKCFGNFDVFHEGAPLRFSYSKSKEVFAYLIDREGVGININELNAVLWEEDHKSYLRNLIVDIQRTLKSVGAEDVFVKRHNECFIDTSKVDCDAYEYKANNPDAIRMYRGEYMIQYPWAIFDAE